MIADLLRERRLRAYLAARTADAITLAGLNVGLAFAVLAATGSTTDLGLTLAARSAPLIGLLLVGGVVGDRVSRRALLILCDTVSALSIGATGVLVVTHSVTLAALMLLQAVDGASSAFRYPAHTALLPQLVVPELRQRAIALRQSMVTGAMLVGAPLAGVLASVINPGWVLILGAGGCAFASLCWVVMGPVAVPVERATSMLHDLREGWREFAARTWLWAIVAQFSVLVSFGVGALEVLGPVVTKAHYGGAKGFGLILAVESIGSLAGGVIAMRVKPQRPLLSGTLGCLPAAAVLAFLAIRAPYVAVLAAAFMFGLGFATFDVLWHTVMQQEVPQDAFARVSSYDAFGSMGLQPVGLAVMGPLASSVGIANALWIGVGAVVVPTLAVLCSRDVRTIALRATPAEEAPEVLAMINPASAIPS